MQSTSAFRTALVVGLIGLQGCDAPADSDGNTESGRNDASTSRGDAAPDDEDNPDAGERSDGGPGRDRDSGAQRDAATTPSGDGSVEPPDPDADITITRTLPEPDRVYVNATVRIQFVVDGISDAEIDLVVGDKTLVRLKYPYRYDLDTRTLTEGKTTLVGLLHGQHSVASKSLELVIDRTAPAVIKRAPSPNADSVWYRDPMGLTFSEPIVPATVTTSSVRVATENAVLIDAALSVASDARSVAIELEELPLELPATFSVSATEAITDRAGNPLTPDSWSFEMPEWVDSPGAPDGDDDPIGFALAMTEAGEQFLAWVDDDNDVRVARRSSGPWKVMPGWSDNDSAIHTLVGVALTDDDQPIVAYIRDVTTEEAGGLPRLVRWDGSAWQDLGSPPGPEQYDAPLFLRRDPAGGAPFLLVGGINGGAMWRVDDTGWTQQAGGGGSTYPVQSMSVLPSGDVLIGATNASGCFVSRLEGNSSTSLGSPSNPISTCMEAFVAAHPDGTPWLVTHNSDQNTWRYRFTGDGNNPIWNSVIGSVFSDSDADDVAFDPGGHMYMITRGSTYVSGMVIVDWSGDYGQPIGNWLDTAEARLAFYGHVPAVVRLRDVTGSSPVRKFDLVVSLRNRM